MNNGIYYKNFNWKCFFFGFDVNLLLPDLGMMTSENTARKVVISTYRMAWLVPASQQPVLNAPGIREKMDEPLGGPQTQIFYA